MLGAAVLGCAPPPISLRASERPQGLALGCVSRGREQQGTCSPAGTQRCLGSQGSLGQRHLLLEVWRKERGSPQGWGGEASLLSQQCAQHPAVPRAAPVLSSCLWSYPPVPCGAAEGQGTRADEELPPGALFGEQLCPQLCGCSEEPLGLLSPAVPGALGGHEGEGVALVLEFCRRTSSLPARKAACL